MPKGTSILHNSVFYLLKQKKVMRAIQVRTSTVKTVFIPTDNLVKQCKLISACSLEISLITVYTAAIPSAHSCRTEITGQYKLQAGQGPAVPAVGTGWKLILGVISNFYRVLPGMETVNFCVFFFAFSVAYNVRLLK